MTEFYLRRVGPQRATGTLPNASPRAFGAGIGAALDQAGGEAAQRNVRAAQHENELAEREAKLAREREEDDATMAAAANFAELRGRMQKTTVDARVAAAPGATGHTATIVKTIDDESAAFLATIANPKVRRTYEAEVKGYRTRVEGDEYTFETGKRVERLVGDTKRLGDASRNRAALSSDPKTLDEELGHFRTAVGAMSVGEDVKAALTREGEEGIARGYLEGLNRTNPSAAKGVLESPLFVSMIRPEVLEVLRSENGVETRRVEVKAAAIEASQKADARELVRGVEADLRDGLPVPKDRLDAAAAAVTSHRLDGHDLTKLSITADVNRSYADATPVQIDARVKTLDAEIARAGDKASPRSIYERDALKTLLPQRKSEVATDPLAFRARNGGTVTPINWGDPATIMARGREARAAAASAGAPVRYFTDEEATELRGLANGAPGQRLEAINRVALFRDLGAVREVAGNDPVFERAVTLEPRYRALAVNGVEARKANAALVPKADSDEAFAAPAAALRHLGGPFSLATVETARNIYASLASRAGKTEWDESLFADAVHMSLGGDRRQGVKHGGIGEWNEAAILLPTGISQDGFDRRLARIGKRLPAGAANGLPVRADGEPVTNAEIRSHTPVAVGDGLYRFERNGRTMITIRGGAPWLLDVRKLPQ